MIQVDIRIEALKFLSESILLVYTSTGDIKVLHTQSFMTGAYTEPTKAQLMDASPRFIFEKMDSRIKLLEPNSALTKEQRQIELERRKFLTSPLAQSMYGSRAAQTIASYEDYVLFMTKDGFGLV